MSPSRIDPYRRGAGPARAFCLLLLVMLGAGCSPESGLALGEERPAADEADIERRLIELTRQVTLARREERGDGVLRRFNQPKSIGCLDATFEVEPLPDTLAQGLFARPARYPARLRFANATEFDDRKADLRGLSIKVLDVPGARSVDGARGVQDFVLNSHPALFAGTPESFLAFVEATAAGRTWWYFVNPFDLHLGSLVTVLRARDTPSSPLAVDYFSTTPYRFGADTTAAVKYSAKACEAPQATEVADDPDRLRQALAAAVNGGELCLDFMVQFQTDPDLMPMEDASVVWAEEISPFRSVARITAGPQDFRGPAPMQACENLRFNPWNGVAAHQPLGGINRVRRNLYEALGEFRHRHNLPREVSR